MTWRSVLQLSIVAIVAYGCTGGVGLGEDAGAADSGPPGDAGIPDDSPDATEVPDAPDPALPSQCADGIDNDSDGSTDFPSDPNCTDAQDDDETDYCDSLWITPLTIFDIGYGPEFEETVDLENSAMFDQATACGTMDLRSRAFELVLTEPKWLYASAVSTLHSGVPIVDVRSADCATSFGCANPLTSGSSVTVPYLPAGTYRIVLSTDGGSEPVMRLSGALFEPVGEPCTSPDECGSHLCQAPTPGSPDVCSLSRCSDGIDNDADGHVDTAADPGCVDGEDNDEIDDCPSGPNCPDCSDGIDNDGDGDIDYAVDVSCVRPSNDSEVCVTTEGIRSITEPFLWWQIPSNAVQDTFESCLASSTADSLFRMDLPALHELTLKIGVPNRFAEPHDGVLYDASCGGPPVACGTFSPDERVPRRLRDIAAGTYYLAAQHWFSPTHNSNLSTLLSVEGRIAPGGSCSDPLAVSGALVCDWRYQCKGLPGSQTCQPGLCGDGLDNDGDGAVDYPYDPGCASLGDETEDDDCPSGPNCPECGNGLDDDGNGMADWPNDVGCPSAADERETFRPHQYDPVTQLTSPEVSGNTSTFVADSSQVSCSAASMTKDAFYALALPVSVVELTLSITASFDAIVDFYDLHPPSEWSGLPNLGCGGVGETITIGHLAPGTYVIGVKGNEVGDEGAYTLDVHATVAPSTPCSSPLFTSGVLSCPAGTSCSGSPAICQ
ncbi:MAG: hypothetical protein AB7O24_15970 [Kofleriaceae bacterium]